MRITSTSIPRNRIQNSPRPAPHPIIETASSPTVPRVPRNEGGYTLVEALVTLLIVLLVTAGVAGGVAFAQRQFEQSIAISESKVLYSTLENAIRNEIAYADLVSVDGDAVRFTSMNYADESGEDPMWELATVDGESISTDGKGEVALVRNGTGGLIMARLLPSTAYTHGMSASVDAEEATIGTETPAIKVLLKIYSASDTEMLNEEFAVIPENATITHD